MRERAPASWTLTRLVAALLQGTVTIATGAAFASCGTEAASSEIGTGMGDANPGDVGGARPVGTTAGAAMDGATSGRDAAAGAASARADAGTVLNGSVAPDAGFPTGTISDAGSHPLGPGDASTGDGGNSDEGKALAATPPMGWNSWNTFQCNISESLIKSVADALVSSGMQTAGYEYVNIDDCWMDGRDADGTVRWNKSKFPSGIPSLAEYIHDKGLKLGIYQSANTATCVGLYGGVDRSVAVGSLGHEAHDAATFASWGVDLLKYDLCAGQRSSLVTMGKALRAGKRPMLYSINPGNGQNDLDPPKPGWDMLGVAHIWRIGFDINASWDSVIRLIDENQNFYDYAGPGHFNDPDMLEVGKLANANEDRAHFAMWAVMAAPLIAGNDIRAMSTTTRQILTNAEIIAVDQDPLGSQGRLVAAPEKSLQVWSKTLSGTNTRAVALFNRGTSPASITVSWSILGLPAGSAMVRDLWAHTDVGNFSQSYTATNVPPHGVAMLRVTSTP